MVMEMADRRMKRPFRAGPPMAGRMVMGYWPALPAVHRHYWQVFYL